MMESRNREYTMSVICSNKVKACVEVYYCMNDRDCDDGLYCNGKERCVEGVCKQQQTASPCTECDEATKCGDTTIHSSALNDSDTSLEGAEPATDPTLIYVLIVGVVIIGGIVVVVLLINIYNWTKRSVY